MKKKSLLPETDLARVALLPADLKRQKLKQVKVGQPLFTYAPIRASVKSIFNAQPNLLPLKKVEWSDIDSAIARMSISRPNSYEPNVAIAKALYKYTQENACPAIEREFMAVAIGRGAKLKLWHDFYFIRDGKPVVCFIDPRRDNGLNESARKFAFSVMQHSLAKGDFEGLQFEILQFDSRGKERVMRTPHKFDVADLIDESVINEAIDSTYNMWFEILEEREEEARQNPQTGTGGLFGW